MTDILEKLRSKHAADVFVSECKDGPTQSGSHHRLDAWAMRRSWSPITMIGYEIKESRSDFLRDDKWPAYLPLCHQLYFVCPRGLIQPEELGEGVGLLWSGEGERLHTKRKAARREIELPAALLVYVLMCRTKITRERVEETSGDREYWWRWLEDKNDRADLGRRVSRRIREMVLGASTRVSAAETKVASYESLRSELTARGINPDDHWAVDAFRRDLGDLVSGGLVTLDRDLANIERVVGQMRRAVDAQKKGKAA